MSEHQAVYAGETLPADVLQNFGGVITAYTPALEASTTNPTLGASSIATGYYSRQSGWVDGFAHIRFGTSGVAAGTGTYWITLPIPILNLGPSIVGVGSGGCTDSSGTDDRLIVAYWLSSDTTSRIRFNIEGATAQASSSNPWVWAASDEIWLYFRYPGNF